MKKDYYIIPSTEVLGLESESVLCQSGVNPYGRGEDFGWGNLSGDASGSGDDFGWGN